MAKQGGRRPAKYRQIADDLLTRIGRGEWPVDGRIPSLPELSAEYGSAQGTIAKALDVLHRLGVAETIHGAGTFIRRLEPERSDVDVAMSRIDEIAGEVRSLRERLTEVEERILPAGSSAVPEPQPVVAAIVVSRQGVLMGRRHDGKPPWTFIAGEIEPGESAADAAVREVKEETGLEVAAGGIIGRRVHPRTGRTMVYMTAAPIRGTGIFVGDADELAEVRWVSLPEADELTGGVMFEPVRDYLRRALPEGLR